MLQYTQKSCATAKSRSVKEILFFFSMSSCWSGLRSLSTSQILSSQAMRKNPKARSSHDNIIHTFSLVLLFLLVHHFLYTYSSFSPSCIVSIHRWHKHSVIFQCNIQCVNVSSVPILPLNWLVLCTVGLVTSLEVSVNSFVQLCVNDDNCGVIVFVKTFACLFWAF